MTAAKKLWNQIGHMCDPINNCHDLQMQWEGSIMIVTQELSVDKSNM